MGWAYRPRIMKFNIPMGLLLEASVGAKAMDEGALKRLIAIQDEVRQAFGWTLADDEASARDLIQTMSVTEPYGVAHWSLSAREATLAQLKERLIQAPLVVLVGAAASSEFLKQDWPNGTVFVAADGAVGACPDDADVACVVTDLDGAEHLNKAALRSIPMVIHAHGDNLSAWQRLLPLWAEQGQPPLILTHQIPSELEGATNVGGFTDGDRAACLLDWCGVNSANIQLVGYSTDHLGRWSGTTNKEQKLEKLQWMQRILSMLQLSSNGHDDDEQ